MRHLTKQLQTAPQEPATTADLAARMHTNHQLPWQKPQMIRTTDSSAISQQQHMLAKHLAESRFSYSSLRDHASSAPIRRWAGCAATDWSLVAQLETDGVGRYGYG